MVLQALLAAGENPIALAWSQGSNNVLTNLRASQGSDGGFIYPGSGESAFTTSQIPAALMRAPYAKAVPFTAGLSVPKTSCASSSPSPSSSSSASASPSSSASASPSASPSH